MALALQQLLTKAGDMELWEIQRGEVRGSVNRPDVTTVVGQLLAGGEAGTRLEAELS